MSIEQSPPPILDELLVDDLEDLRTLANPFRLRLLYYFRTPRSVAEVAELIGVPVTRLYYHVNLLAGTGVITVVETRKKGPQLEKVYRIVAHSLRPSPAMLETVSSPTEFAEVATSLILDSTRSEIISSLEQHAASGFDPEAIIGTLGRTMAALPPDRVAEVIEKLNELTREVKAADTGSENQMYGLTYSFFPIEPPTTAAPNTKEHE